MGADGAGSVSRRSGIVSILFFLVGLLFGAAVTTSVAYPVLRNALYDSDALHDSDASAATVRARVLVQGLPCENAQPQSPKDVSDDFVGLLLARSSNLDVSSVHNLAMANVHYHLGAEHRSAGEYDFSKLEDSTFDADLTEYGYYCDNTDGYQADSDAGNFGNYSWEHCTNTEVGQTYEMHYVYSSGTANEDGIVAGLGGAFAVQNNPTVTVRAQVYYIVNDDSADADDFGFSGWNTALITDAVAYTGSTTGRNYDNTICSPYQITWHVDRTCQRVSAKSFDAMCQKMKEMDMSLDAEPHWTRDLVAANYSSSVQKRLSTTEIEAIP
jgi:hypothetical protein